MPPISPIEQQINIEISNRLFQSVDDLIAKGRFENVNQFCTDIEFPRANYYRLKRDPSLRVPVIVLFRLIDKYKVNARWLMTGKK